MINQVKILINNATDGKIWCYNINIWLLIILTLTLSTNSCVLLLPETYLVYFCKKTTHELRYDH